MNWSGYFRFLTGMIDVHNILSALHQCRREKGGMDRVTPCMYAISREELDEENWKVLLKALKKKDFISILHNFLKQFEVPDELIQFIDNVYGLYEEDKVLLRIDPDRIIYESVFEEDQNGNFILVKMQMPLLYQHILDSCITALVYSYYRILRSFVDYYVKYKNRPGQLFFHKAQCSNPWLEEICCFAFEVVFENDGRTAGCSSVKRRRDSLSCIPLIVLGTCDHENIGKDILEADYGSEGLTEESINRVKGGNAGIPDGIIQNTYCWRNVLSPYVSNFPSISYNSEYIYVDTYFGYSYNEDLILDDTVLYGESSLVPAPFEQIMDIKMDGYLRIPFIRIGKVRVKNEDELINLLLSLSRYDGELLFRGQTTEYFLNRSSKLMKKLYGDEQAKEPSLASYALRIQKNFEDFYIEWAGLIHSYLQTVLEVDVYHRYMEYNGGIEFYDLCLAVAQHYGLPTYGLDASPSLSTALFFALHEFKEKDASQRIFKYERKEKGESVLYVFKGEPGERFEYGNLTSYLSGIEKAIFPRPFLQQACFLHTGWGNSRNACANDMVLAINFNAEDIDIDRLNDLLIQKANDKSLDEKNFFVENDLFINYLKGYVDLESGKGYNREFKQFLKDYIYQVNGV